VVGAQFCVHIVAAQSGRRATGAQVVAWQQLAGTQSASCAHSAPGDTAPPLGRSSRTWAPPMLTAGGRSPEVPVAVEVWRGPPDWMDAGEGGYAPAERGPGSA